VRAFLLAVFITLPLSAAASPPVRVDIRWEYLNFGAAVDIFEIEGRQQLWKTESVKEMKDTPVAGPIEGASFTLAPGGKKRFALVVRNETAEPLYFFAAPHVVDPVEHSLGFKFKCLCIDHAYTVGPGEIWYRIVEFRLSQDHVGDALTVTHSVIGIDKTRAESFALKPNPSDF